MLSKSLDRKRETRNNSVQGNQLQEALQKCEVLAISNEEVRNISLMALPQKDFLTWIIINKIVT